LDAWIDFHGIAVELAYPSFEEDAFTALFSAFPRAEPKSSAHAISIALGVTDQPSEAPGPGWVPSFFYGVAQGFACGDQYLIWDGRSAIHVDIAGKRIAGALRLPDPHLTASGMQHVALSLLLRRLGTFDLHAAGASDGQRTLLIVGDSGAGKTTVVLSLLGAGCSFLGDDRVLIREQHARLEVLGYPREFHVSPQTLHALGLAAPEQAAATDGKYRIDPLSYWPRGFRASSAGPLTVLLPRIADQRKSALRRVPSAETFGRLLGSSAHVALPTLGNTEQQLQLLKSIADSAVAWELELGADSLETPHSLAELILRETE
jgi:hypothetical protein